MKCANCGTVNSEQETVCKYCGEPLKNEEKTRQERTGRKPSSGKKLPVKALAAVGGVVLAILLIVIVAVNLPGGGSGDYYIADRTVLPVIFDDDTIYFLADGEKIDSRLDADEIIDWEPSMDGNVVYFSAKEGSDTMAYVLSGKSILTVTDNADQVLLSESGAALAYVQDEELYLYRVAKKTAEKLASDVEQIIAISPDGETVAYMSIDDVCYIQSGKNTLEMGEDITVISVSNEGKYIYTIEEDEEGRMCLNLYNMKGSVGVVATGVKDVQTVIPVLPDEGQQGSTGEKAALTVDVPLFYTNADHSQLIFQAEAKSGYKWYVTEKEGQEDNKHDLTAADLLKPVLPANVQTYTRGDLTVLGVDSLNDALYSTSNAKDESMKMVYVDKDWQTATLVSKVTEIQIDLTGELAYYMKNGSVYSVEVSAGAQPKTLADEVASYKVSSNGKGIYYMDDYGVLFYQKTDGQSKQVYEDVDEYYVNKDGYVLFTSEYGLYCAKGADSVQTLTEDFETGYVMVTADCTYYVVEEDDSLNIYAASSGMKFQKLGVLLDETEA